MNDNDELTMERKTTKDGKHNMLKLIVIIVILIVVFGTLLNLYLVYSAASSVDIDPKRVQDLQPVTMQDYELSFVLILKNPSGTEISVEKITYDIYMEDDFIGSGEKTDFSIQPGDHEHVFSFSFNIFELSTAIRNQILSSNILVKIQGKITIPLLLMRLVKVGVITADYELIEEI